MEGDQKQPKDDYDHVNVALEQWKTCANLANSISSRRDSMNNLFVTLNLALIAATTAIDNMVFVAIAVAGVAFCIVWRTSIAYYRIINQAKYEVILKIEESLPYQAFDNEWKICKSNENFREGTVIEKYLSIFFIVNYCLIVVVKIFVLI